MSRRIPCPDCRTMLVVTPAAEERGRMRCPECETVITVPGETTEGERLRQLVRDRAADPRRFDVDRAPERDGRKRPAVVWAHSKRGGIGVEEWAEGSAPMSFIKAGFVVMCPSWRGENDNPGRHEMFFGEVDDAVAAIEYAARLPYVDSKRV